MRLLDGVEVHEGFSRYPQGNPTHWLISTQVPGASLPAKAEQFSQVFCEGDPPGVQDDDHVYDLRHEFMMMGLIGVHTYYYQALLKCFEELTSDEDAFKLCVVVTDGQISEDRHQQATLAFGCRRWTILLR